MPLFVRPATSGVGKMESGALTVLTKSQRILFGVVVLILVDMICVSLTELAKVLSFINTKSVFC